MSSLARVSPTSHHAFNLGFRSPLASRLDCFDAGDRHFSLSFRYLLLATII